MTSDVSSYAQHQQHTQVRPYRAYGLRSVILDPGVDFRSGSLGSWAAIGEHVERNSGLLRRVVTKNTFVNGIRANVFKWKSFAYLSRFCGFLALGKANVTDLTRDGIRNSLDHIDVAADTKHCGYLPSNRRLEKIRMIWLCRSYG